MAQAKSQGIQKKRKQQTIQPVNSSVNSGSQNNQSFATGHAQKTEILTYLKKGCWITPMDALKLFGCFRLAYHYQHRIWNWQSTSG